MNSGRAQALKAKRKRRSEFHTIRDAAPADKMEDIYGHKLNVKHIVLQVTPHFQYLVTFYSKIQYDST